MFKIDCSSLLGLVVALMFVLILGVKAEAGQDHQQGTKHQRVSGIEVTDADLDKVAEAYKAVTMIRERLQEKLSHVSDKVEAQQLQEQAGQEMLKAVTAQGLDVQTYNDIMEAIQEDEKLRNAFLEKLKGMY
jgi:NAD(P)H-nitrite reductase large subunit